tara:strand:- start:343 stop:1293 length:951 start_codon:yes stop_codon:yes gene_type:complete
VVNVDWREEVLKSTGVFEDGCISFYNLASLVVANRPECIYRYRSGHKGDLIALQEGYEHLSYPNDYNDPFDARIFFDKDAAIIPGLNDYLNKNMNSGFREALKVLAGKDKLDVHGERADKQLFSRAKSQKPFEKYFDHISKQCEAVSLRLEEILENSLRGAALICSFATNKRNYLMWAHYAKSHQGFCLEYEFPYSTIDNGLFLPVSYRQGPVDVTHLVRKSWTDSSQVLFSAAMGSALVKGDAWEYEGEWRYVSFGKRDSRKLNGLKLNRVLVGCNASDQLKNEVLKKCYERGVEVVQMKRSSNSFDVVEGERLL